MSLAKIGLKKVKLRKPKTNWGLRRSAINYQILAKQKIKGLWSLMYNDNHYGKIIYEKLTKNIKDSSSRCAYCQDKVFHNANLNIDHILPASTYPQFTFEKSNLAVSCITCNAIKGDNDYFNLPPNSTKYYPKSNTSLNCFHPTHHHYANHIDRIIVQTNHISLKAYIGRTPEGIALCSNLLLKVSEFEIKAIANPKVAQAVDSIGKHIANFPSTENKALKNLLKSLAEKI